MAPLEREEQAPTPTGWGPSTGYGCDGARWLLDGVLRFMVADT